MIKTVDVLLGLWAEQSMGARNRLGSAGIGISAVDVERVVMSLPDELRGCIKQHYFDAVGNLSKQAELNGVSEKTIQRRLHRAHEKIATALKIPLN